MKMTKKDYNLIAAELRAAFSRGDLSVKGLTSLAHSMAAALARDNPRFNSDLFIRTVLGE
jgi:hypothetical protein